MSEVMAASSARALVMRSPAKINLFLHITGQRSDGYHLLETVFQFLDFADTLKFEVRQDRRIVRRDEHEFSLPKNDLIIRATELLRKEFHTEFQSSDAPGVRITLTKKIPPGSGMGGGSSNAATTLLALNRLWNLGLTRDDLLPLAARLGADVPLFIYGKSCWATGIGDVFERFEPPQHWCCMCLPSVAVSTSAVFSRFDQRGHSSITKKALSKKDLSKKAMIKNTLIKNRAQTGNTANDLEPITRALHPEVDQALKTLSLYGDAKMNGSGCSIYLRCDSKDQASEICRKMPSHLNCAVTRTLNDITEYS